MRTKLLSWMLLCGLAAVFALCGHAQQAQVAGRILAARVKGTVTATNTVDNTKRALHDNDAITEKYVVTTGQDSSVILVFSNGATINLAHDSSLAIEQFLQDPFSTSYSMATASTEPTTSTTKLSLARGELVGNVKHLNQAGGSTFSVNTPVGAAGIRGTTFRIVFRPDDSGKAFFSLSTAEGVVVLTGTSSQEVVVTAGKEVTVTFDVTVDAQTGKISVKPQSPFEVQDIPAATAVLIAAAAQEIIATHVDLVFTSPTTSNTIKPEGAPTGETPPPPQQPQDQTTPGDGK